MSATLQLRETVVSRWVDAFNARDVEGMLACLDPDVSFRPLRLRGLDRSYLGHDGVQRWFARLGQLGHDHRLDLSEVRGAGQERVLAVGALSLAEESDVAQFCALHWIPNGLILATQHYLSDPHTMQRVHLIP